MVNKVTAEYEKNKKGRCESNVELNSVLGLIVECHLSEACMGWTWCMCIVQAIAKELESSPMASLLFNNTPAMLSIIYCINAERQRGVYVCVHLDYLHLDRAFSIRELQSRS